MFRNRDDEGARTPLLSAIWRARLVSAGLWLLLLSGPALGATALVAMPAPAPDRPGQTGPRTNIRSGAGPEEFAARYVGDWARGADAERLRRYFPGVPELADPQVTVSVRSLRTAAAEELRPGYWAVTVTGEVGTSKPGKEHDPGDDADEKAAAGPRMWRVGVLASGGPAAGGTSRPGTPAGYVATGLPAEVGVPARTELPDSPYATVVDGAPGTIGRSAEAFLRLYLTGRAGLDRYLAPGTRVEAPRSTPYLDMRVVSLAASGDMDLSEQSSPRDGEVINVLVTVEPHTDAGPGPRMQYALELSGRAGRWEVSGLDQAPRLLRAQEGAGR